ncbi:tRNA (adenosine(37)-N6)-dimethylallyltransferase MiaA [Paenibacillus lignilyticus]|uniref:tRNA dimethylallyltransferase n=1 Tax=Paenibacillus lignilyticus TaxID=1172615 RepID=A0ABS5CBR4_9BACL|nr:tRNA (adenosine(37)-N6)-dimethylallyltransferase MiaA [Paenibacillus lignilyticus]MBP3963414.1 tRNA (adenosine(37)-N6)-dimethylallyltransferase MiaA [Paenibacillus lignilyticus]
MSSATTHTESSKPKLLVLIGPTAVGKTRLSLELAKACNAEIISGDSIQVYKGMDIGTAKIKPEEREGIPHHLIDICDPTHSFSVAEFQERCAVLIPEIESRGKLPFIVGGTGLYVESVAYGYDFAEVGSDDAYREEQRLYALAHGAEALHERLRAVDSEAADRLHPNDQRRVIRALEVHHLTGSTVSQQLEGQKKTSPFELCIVGLTMDRAKLYERINERVDAMMDEGLVDEVKRLLADGVPANAVSMHGLGYKEIVLYLEGHLTLEEAVELLKRDTRRFAKRQLSWFRHMSDIHWIDTDENFHKNLQAIYGIIAGKFKIDIEYTFNQPFDDGGNAQ